MNYGLLLRQIREDRNLTIAKVAKKANMSTSQLHRLETGSRNLYLEDFIRICVAVEVKPGDLLPNSQGEYARYTRVIHELRAFDPDVGDRIPDFLRALRAVIETAELKARLTPTT